MVPAVPISSGKALGRASHSSLSALLLQREKNNAKSQLIQLLLEFYSEQWKEGQMD